MPTPPASLRILYLGSLPPRRDSLAIVGGQLVSGLAARGHRVRGVSWITRGAEKARAAGDPLLVAQPRSRVTRVLMPPGPALRALAPDAHRREFAAALRGLVERQLPAQRPDVLLIGSTSLAECLPELTALREVPTVLTLHGGTAFAIRDGRVSETASRAIIAGLRRVDQLVAVSPQIARVLRPLGLEGIRVVGNPVDLLRFAPGPKDHALMGTLGVDTADVVVAHASDLSLLKRPLDIVGAAERALRADPRLLFLILGDGPLRSAMEQACARSGLISRFRFPGWVDHSAISGFLRLADVVVMPSELEARSLVYLETQACGRVLLASDIPAAREVIVDGETGMLFRKGDVAQLAAKTLEAASDPDRRAAIGRRARRAAEAHSLDLVVSAYEAILREVVARGRRRP